ncbi:helix-turn-helix DNA-binding protein [Mycobacterium phage Morrow]|uniref:DNA binding protein n=73 Tax=Backyardiganvirus TaxID=2946815 RepID=A0A1B1SE36_9CAUD|nr:sigma-K factor [Mycobacterium phage Peaches]YP_009005610.1 sigma-K factor [Mycobacterium phage BellusTerra]YP_009005890.1 sigma-K factor [Mycobacterium phage Nyxis]YP_009007244.1 sigma-K factor [Mycobacterium phage Obama12]YP_009018838.1 sigma-K factor [Mycobacterium phage LHTSCC]YP_009031911.1 sigma-K factor [Mycobacterium phage Kampy]YP_009190911.1 sigma-K factor [Mycobacterium phage Iracema64]YP_009638708.1 sigma-K factor [Mycobacterium phage Arturo]YP_010062525.1 sigma-K factor [Myco
MTSHMVKVMEAAAKSALVTWGREGGLDDLVQDLWVWYLERPATQRKLEELSKPEAIATVRRAAIQILTEQVLAGNKFNGRNLYSSEAVKDVLKDRSNNRYLKDIMPTAMAALEKQHAVYAEALRSRYDDGVIPQDGPSQDALKNAHKAITEHVNIIVITAGDVSSAAVQAETRKSSGGRSDPTADAAIALIEKGDEELELTDQEGNVTGTTTYRTELANVFDDWITQSTGDSSEVRLDIFDGMFNGDDRMAMYRAQVFPELFPDEKPMLIDNWPAEDRELYCGGEYTPGYLRLVKGGK